MAVGAVYYYGLSYSLLQEVGREDWNSTGRDGGEASPGGEITGAGASGMMADEVTSLWQPTVRARSRPLPQPGA